jgi:hypothetical protein
MLPVNVSGCSAQPSANGFDVTATVESRADRPISRLDMSMQFYQDFRYRKFTGFANLPQELDPGQKQSVKFAVTDAGGARVRGQAIRCFVTHIGYLDGTSENAPAIH